MEGRGEGGAGMSKGGYYQATDGSVAIAISIACTLRRRYREWGEPGGRVGGRVEDWG